MFWQNSWPEYLRVGAFPRDVRIRDRVRVLLHLALIRQRGLEYVVVEAVGVRHVGAENDAAEIAVPLVLRAQVGLPRRRAQRVVAVDADRRSAEDRIAEARATTVLGIEISNATVDLEAAADQRDELQFRAVDVCLGGVGDRRCVVDEPIDLNVVVLVDEGRAVQLQAVVEQLGLGAQFISPDRFGVERDLRTPIR